jgi:hypothetical protein
MDFAGFPPPAFRCRWLLAGSWRELSERSFNTLMKHATVYEAQERALSQRKAAYRECVKAEQVAEQRLHAAEQERAAARLAQAQAAGAVRIKQRE